MAKLAAFLALACLAVASADQGVIKTSLLTAFSTQEKVDISLSFKDGVSRAYSQIHGKNFETRGSKISSLRSALISNAETSQQSLVKFLKSRSLSFETFWITNRIIVKNVDFKLAQELAQNFPEVVEIRDAVTIKVEEFSDVKSVDIAPSQGTVQWGISLIQADKLWESGTRGEGIIVANVDTGVRGTHRVLSPNFIGSYGWYDPQDKTTVPTDTNGHGSHTMGSIAGQDGYGIAPGSKWMACAGCPGGSCPESALLACAQWVFCPTDVQGNNPDCTKAPHLVSNSWGSTLGGQTWYDDGIKAWHSAGIIPIFSAGNSGPFCETVGSPGDRDVIGVAATDKTDTLAYFSSLGPSPSGGQKPEISAPGVDVLSAWIDNDNSFATLSGTSMACPHVAGVVALLLQNNPSLVHNYEGVRDVLFNGVKTAGLTGLGMNCEGTSETSFPNYAFGYGRIDALASSQLTKKHL